MRHADRNIEWRNYNMNLRIRWLCYSKWKAGDAVRAVEDSRVTRRLGARSEAFHLLVHGLVFSVAKSSNQAVC
jgi:hypothetical protein